MLDRSRERGDPRRSGLSVDNFVWALANAKNGIGLQVRLIRRREGGAG